MGKILYIDAFTKPKVISKNTSISGNFIEPDRHNNNLFQKNNLQFAETDKYLDYFSVSGWLNKKKESRKYRNNR